MKFPLTITVLLLGVIGNAWADESGIAIGQARQASLALGKTLKQELVSAMKRGGPVEAISVCNLKAMPLTEQISTETGWQVARTSLKVRNPANSPDDWERHQLQQFQARLDAGESMASLEAATTEQRDGKSVQRFMKAIPVQGPCLVCHGTELAPAVAQKLDSLYPNDQARGYQLGELRGAFTLERVISGE
ncbi:DUF3365 domain-containing protein [Microbulbifer flavimaris]|uniref:DUF3365 domain-containing protein n=1 Tax=Microbulbifer flavimaris TaxID=1781068 RepID=A0ABX4HW48_9GAMM|nr:MULTISPECIES: DUF3365 domain-containing protein [Microbulbifer]PCO04327.1 DUF3365 domain-containing protein [Microbulbifer flavimaris]